MATLDIFAPSFSGAAYNAEEPTKNTEELSRYLLDLFTQMATAGFVLSDEGGTETIISDLIWTEQRANLIKQNLIFDNWKVAHEIEYPAEADLLHGLCAENVGTFNALGEAHTYEIYQARAEMLSQHERTFRNILLATGTSIASPLTISIQPQAETEQDEIAIESAWGIQSEMIDLEISRLNTLLNTMSEAENLEMPDFDTEDTRGLITGILAAWAFYQKWKDVVDIIMTATEIAFFAYDIYKRFQVEKEELRNLPIAIIDLLERTIKLLEKLKELEMSRQNFEFRQDLLNTMSQRIDDQMELYRAGKANAESKDPDLSNLEQAIADLQYNGEEYELINGLKVSLHGKLVGG